MSKHSIRLVLVLVHAVAASASACLWDEDTLRDEQRGLPTVASILAGKWERHSEFFYQDRVRRMQALLSEEPNKLDALDNLAVALEKLGRVDEAIDVMQRKLQVDPNGYTTHANLGTFYFHRGGQGDLDRGIAHIERATEINPDAHFGREKYQLQIARYVRDAAADPSLLDRGSFVVPLILRPHQLESMSSEEIDDHMSRRRNTGRPSKEIDEAITGVVGMIRFGTGTSPHLFYALGDLLAVRGDMHLGYRAYHRAMELGHPRPQQLVEAMQTVRGRHEDKRNFDHPVIDAERRAGEEWVAAYQAHEDELLRSGRDPADDSNYVAFYNKWGDIRTAPSARDVWIDRLFTFGARHRTPLILMIVILILASGATLNHYRKGRAARRKASIPG